MDTNRPSDRRPKVILAKALAIVAVLSIAFLVTTVSYAAPISPFIGKWEATDVDGSDMNLSIAGNQQGILQITWTDKYIALCNGKAGLLRGTGWLNASNPNLLEADVHLACFTTGASLDFHVAFRYHSATNTLFVRYDFGEVTIWYRPGKPKAAPPVLNLRVNYGHDWVESFYVGGHGASVIVIDKDGNVKATAQLVIEPKDYWGGQTGFQSLDGVWLDAGGNQMDSPPDIQPNDWVFGWVDNGASAQVQIGDISGKIGLATNSIKGTITAPWFTEPVQVECLDWFQQPPAPNKDGGFVSANGSDTYACTWPQEEWDIQPDQTVGVGYFGPDGNWVSNGFTAPFPRIIASEAGDWFWVTGFYPGLLDLFIYESADEGANPLWSGQAVATDLWGITLVGRDVHGQDLVPGNYVVVSDGVNEKGVVLETITMEVFDIVHEIMAGTAPAGRDVTAAAGPQDWQYRITVQADPVTGAWLADFKAEGFDITEDMQPWSFAQIFDEDGDANEAGAPVTILVTDTGDTLSDDGTCTLREAIIAANTNLPSGGAEGECRGGMDQQRDTIVLAAGSTYSLSIDRTDDTPADGDLDVYDNSAAIDLVIEVEGEGKATISQDAPVVDDRVLENHEATVQIENLVLTGGGNVGGGGGLLNNGTMDINGSEFSGNSVGWDGGGIWNSNTGVMSVDGSTIRGNTSSAFAGGVMNKGLLVLKNCQITGNTDVYGGGGINNEGTLAVDNCVLSANTSGQGGALYNSGTATISNGTLVGGQLLDEANTGDGGGLFNLGTLTVNDSTVTGNRNPGGPGGGIFNWIGGMLTVSHSTVSSNHAGDGGGLFNMEGSLAVIENGSIFSGNTAEGRGGAIENWGAITVMGSVLRDNVSAIAAGSAFGGISAGSTARISGSCIVGNADIAVFSEEAAPVEATGNWWGDASGPALGYNPGPGDSVGDFVAFDPWLDAPPEVCAP